MNEPKRDDHPAHQPQLGGELRQIVDAFRAAWEAALLQGPPPDLVEALSEVSAGQRSHVRESLEEIDRHYRCRLASKGTAPATEDFSSQPTEVNQAGDNAADVEQANGQQDLAPTIDPSSGDAERGRSPMTVDFEIDTSHAPQEGAANPGVMETVDPASSPAELSQETAGFEFDETRDDEESKGSAGVTATIDPGAEQDRATGAGPASAAASPRGKRGRKAVVDAALPGYEILGELGRGGMGVVYYARQTKLKRFVALKMLLAGGHAGPDHLERFRTEAEAVAHLQHPNIVQIYDVGEQNGLPYFSLEFVDGPSLDKQIKGKPQPPQKVAETVEILARAMDYAHRRGILHRDLKPANVLIAKDGVPKITDFGLAKQMEGDSSQTRTGTIMGTPSYMAPEQGRGMKDIGPLADVYALGAMLYEMCTGRPPFVAATAFETLMQALKEEPIPPAQLQRNLPRDLETITLKCLQKEPEKRYASAEELADDLRRFQDGEPIQARPVGSAERVWRWCLRNKKIAAISAVALSLLISLAVGGPTTALLINEQRQRADQNRILADASAHRAEESAEEARQAEQEAKDNLELARLAQSDAEKNARRADRNAQSATKQADLALGALQTLVNEVQDRLRETPDTYRLKQELLKTALDGLRDVAQSAENSQIVSGNMSLAYRKMGKIFESLGQSEEARRQYEHFHDTVIAMASADKNRARALRNMSVALSTLGDGWLLVGDKARARDCYRRAHEHRTRLANANPKNRLVKVDLATTFIKLGAVSDPQESETCFRRALALREEVVRMVPKDKPGEYRARLRDVWISYSALAEFLLNRPSLTDDLLAEVRQHYEVALATAQELIALAPTSNLAKQDAAVTHLNLGRVMSRRKDEAAARQHFDHTIELLEPLAKADAENVALQQRFAQALAYRGRHEEAATQAETLRHLAPVNHRNLYNVACCYSLCVLAAEDEMDRRRYTRMSVQALEQAFEYGLKASSFVEIDSDLDPIRDDSGFRKLLAQQSRKVEEAAVEQTTSADPGNTP